jgi:hypothetical protein
MASEREGLSRSPLRQSSMACLYSTPRRKLRTGACPVAGLPRFLRNTTFGVDIAWYYEKNLPEGIACYKKSSPVVFAAHLSLEKRGRFGEVRKRIDRLISGISRK